MARLGSHFDPLDKATPEGGFSPIDTMRRRRAEASGPVTHIPHAEAARLESVTVTGQLLYNKRTRDFNGPTGTIVYDESESFDGYTLSSPMNRRATYLIDMQGQVVHKWDLPKGMSIFIQAYLLPGGNLLRGVKSREVGRDKGGRGATLQEVNWSGKVVWEYQSSDR